MTGYNSTLNQKIASRAIISALALWLAFSGVAAAEQLYVNESGWWRDGGAFNVSGTAPIQAAVGAADAGDAIFVWNGSYSENVNVYKQLTLEGEGAEVVTVTAASSGDHVFEVTADYVNISGFAVRGATDNDMAGIRLTNVDYCNISENNMYGNDDGIVLSGSSNNMLKNNTVSSNAGYGIFLDSSSNNTLTDNIANSNNGHGIYLSSSSNNTLTNNMVKSKTGYGIGLCSSSNNNIENNLVNLINSGGAASDPDGAGGIILSDYCNYNTLTNNTLRSSTNGGIILRGSSNNTMNSNNCSNNSYGIFLYGSSNNTMKSNNVSNNSYGIFLYISSNYNTLTNNTVNSNTGDGICLDNADNNIITCNLVKNNTERGFYLHSGSTGNNISYNNIVENGNYNTSTGGWGWQVYIDQYNLVEAKHNYWGAGMNNSMIDASIHDDEEGGWGEVEFYPFETEPVKCPLTPETPAFTTTDAMIALQIAVGSRPPDSRYDVSGDGSVTSLDALMILQAVAGSIKIG